MDAANIDLIVRPGRTLTNNYQLTTDVINGDPVPRDVTGATFTMQLRSNREPTTAVDLTPAYTAIDLTLGAFNFEASPGATDAMTTTSGVYEIEMTLDGFVTTEFEGNYSVILPVVR